MKTLDELNNAIHKRDTYFVEAAIRERDAYFVEAARAKSVLSDVIPALELASNCKADELRESCPKGIENTPDEWAALWMARAILELNPIVAKGSTCQT